ncbi:MAG: 3-isopropylmalate dehydratase small subunit [Patescibacteria group bacterium]|nr:3-isopropylmalate dehydratase small subunit [Patescibacteria group bacterium]MBU1876803.1 3-isopropylmalate dehydratase small subunit [Patescibacteria group bacterium]
MEITTKGQVYLLDRLNIDTDQIISAKYLTGITMNGLGLNLFEDLDLPGFDRKEPAFKEATILVARENFGCGSSREHAVWALEDSGFQAVIASSFARIFRQNMFNRGLLAIELSAEQIDEIFVNKWKNCLIDLKTMTLTFWSDENRSEKKTCSFQLADFDKQLVLEGGLVGFVVKHY